jgi:hypothetical protein
MTGSVYEWRSQPSKRVSMFQTLLGWIRSLFSMSKQGLATSHLQSGKRFGRLKHCAGLQYCISDVQRTRLLFRRYHRLSPERSTPEYQRGVLGDRSVDRRGTAIIQRSEAGNPRRGVNQCQQCPGESIRERHVSVYRPQSKAGGIGASKSMVRAQKRAILRFLRAGKGHKK